MKGNISKKELPREKALFNGIESLTDEELLAVLLKCGTKDKDVFELSKDIIKKYQNFNNLLNLNYKELISIEGIKQAKAIELLSILEIAKRIQKNNIMMMKKITHPRDIYNQFKILLSEEKQECFVVLFLDIKSRMIKYEQLFKGGLSTSIVDVATILKKSLGYSASKIICLHNHPSGDTTPSTLDIETTKRIQKGCDILNIILLDHIIIGKNDYFSFKENEIID